MASDFEVLVGVIHVAFNDPSIEWGIFRVEESANSITRTVLWVPTTFKTEAPKYSSPSIDPDTGMPVQIGYQDFLTVECQITGTTFEDACNTRARVLTAVRIALGTASTPTTGAYMTELEGKSGHLWGGACLIVQHFVWQMNVELVDVIAGAGEPFICAKIIVDAELHDVVDNSVSIPIETFEIPTP